MLKFRSLQFLQKAQPVCPCNQTGFSNKTFPKWKKLYLPFDVDHIKADVFLFSVRLDEITAWYSINFQENVKIFQINLWLEEKKYISIEKHLNRKCPRILSQLMMDALRILRQQTAKISLIYSEIHGKSELELRTLFPPNKLDD